MSRLNFKVGDFVIYKDDTDTVPPLRVQRVEPALDDAYFLSNGTWCNQSVLSTYVEPVLTWEEVEAHIKTVIQEIRTIFQDRDVNGMRVVIKAEGRCDGEIKISYSVAESDYDSNKASSYSLRPSLDEFFRGKTWKARNEPLSLSYDGGIND